MSYIKLDSESMKNISRFSRLSARGKASETTIVIPCFNDAPRARVLIESIIGFDIKGEHSFPQTCFKEIVLIDDGSTTTENVESFFSFLRSFKNIPFTLLKHEKNKGKGAALKTGFEYALSKEDKPAQFLLLDADLTGVTEGKLIKAIEKANINDQVIFRCFGKNIFVTAAQFLYPRLNGVRIVSRNFVKDVLEKGLLSDETGYNVENVFNKHVKSNGQKLIYKNIAGVSQHTKFEKHGVFKGGKLHFKMLTEVHIPKKHKNKG